MDAPLKTKIFVGGLPKNCSEEVLEDLFEDFGEVKECDVIGYHGFVHMATPKQAEDAIRNLNNYNLRGSIISVVPSKSKFHPEPGAPGRAYNETATYRRKHLNLHYGPEPYRSRSTSPSRGEYPHKHRHRHYTSRSAKYEANIHRSTPNRNELDWDLLKILL